MNTLLPKVNSCLISIQTMLERGYLRLLLKSWTMVIPNFENNARNHLYINFNSNIIFQQSINLYLIISRGAIVGEFLPFLYFHTTNPSNQINVKSWVSAAPAVSSVQLTKAEKLCLYTSSKWSVKNYSSSEFASKVRYKKWVLKASQKFINGNTNKWRNKW